MLAYGFLDLDLSEYFQRLFVGWRGYSSFELVVVHLVTSLRLSMGRKIARRVMRRKGCFFYFLGAEPLGLHLLGGQSASA
jgi:hypothetical protein